MPKSEAKTLDLSAKIPKGSHYDIKVMRQPEGFSQYCYVEQGKGSYKGGDIALQLSCIKGFAKVSTYAGKAGTKGNANGAFSEARFSTPAHMVFDSKGNLFVVDYNNHQIRKITPQGTVSLFAGNAGGASGTNDGTGAAASFSLPYAIAVDNADNLYVGSIKACVRKITPEAKVTTLAGLCGTGGDVPVNTDFSAVKTGAEARFGSISGMVYDGGNALYMFDNNNKLIRKISINDGTSANARVQNIIDTKYGDVSMVISADKKSLYYIPRSDCKLYQLDLTNTGTPKATPLSKGGCGFADGDFNTARFYPSLNQIIASKSGQFLYLADAINHRIRRIDLINQKVHTLAGDGTGAVTDGIGTNAAFKTPRGIAQDAQGDLFVSSDGHVIRKIENVTKYQLKLNVIDLDGAKGLVLQNNGGDDLSVTSTTVGFGQMKLGDYKVSIKHQAMLALGDENKRFCGVKNGTGTISKADATVDIVCYRGLVEVSTYAGKANTSGNANGALSEARFFNPAGLVFDSKGNLFVADYANHQIRKITPKGTVSLFAGDANGALGTDDGTGSAAKFYKPFAIAIDEADNLYVGSDHNCVRKITPNAVVTTLAGKCGTTGGGDNPVKTDVTSNDTTGADARFRYISGIAYVGSGHLYVFDSQNMLIRKISLNDGTAANARVQNIIDTKSDNVSMGLSADKKSLYYIPRSDCKLYKLNLSNSSATEVTTKTGCGFRDGDLSGQAQFSPSFGQIIATDSGQALYLVDLLNQRIRYILLAPDGGEAPFVYTLAGKGTKAVTDGIAPDKAEFANPYGIAQDAQGNLFVSSDGHVIRKLKLVPYSPKP